MNVQMLEAMARSMKRDADVLAGDNAVRDMRETFARRLAANLSLWADLLGTIARDVDDGITIPLPPVPMERVR